MWKDLKVEEKIERMRQEIKHTSGYIVNANRKVQKLRDEFISHDHKDGKVVKNIKQYEEMDGELDSLRPDPKAEAEGNIYF